MPRLVQSTHTHTQLGSTCNGTNFVSLPAVLGEDKTDFGMLSDDDHLWKKHKREKQQQQVKRAKRFLETLFDNAEEQVIVVVTHSGFIRSLLLEVDREPYRPKNAEVVPALVERRRF